MTYFIPKTILANLRKSLALGVQILMLVACQSTTQVKMVEIETGSDKDHSNQIANQALEMPPISANQEEDVIEKSDNLWVRLQTQFQLEAHYKNPAVDDELTAYIYNQAYFDRITERAEPFLFWIVTEIERRNLPMELALIPIVESTFNPNAYSPKHAVGLWQFIGPTAKSFGLQQDWWYDGRRDPRASTVAALDFLEQLYKEFDEDWLLALAAYNTGQGNVNRAIKKTVRRKESPDFWSLPLPRETRAHVPKILALAKLISNSKRYGVELAPIENKEPLAIIEIDSQIDLSQAAKLAKLDYSELRRLNPGYLQWATHPDNPQVIAVPIDHADFLRDGISNLGPDHFISWDRYEIQPGDTLSGIAIKLRTEIDVLKSVNKINGTRIIAGDSLLIPRTNDPSLLVNINQENLRGRRILPTPNIYIVRNGDNLWSIARRFDLRSKDIAGWNNILLDSILKPGQELNLEFVSKFTQTSNISDTASAENYRVRSGDVLFEIAKRYRIKLENLLKWNNLTERDLIYPDQLIRIIPPETN